MIIAATMSDDALSPSYTRAAPTNGTMQALASWNRNRHAPKVSQCQRILPTVDTANWPWLTDVGSAAANLGRAARGSVAPRKMACRAAAGRRFIRGSRSSTRARGAAWSLPLSNRGAEMDAKTRDLALLTALSLSCAGVAWILDYLVFGLVFFALGVAAGLEIAREQ